MKYVRSVSSLLPLAGALLVCVAVIAWQPDTTKATLKNRHQNHSDTTIPKSADIDQIDIQLNLDSVMAQVNLAISKIDYAKMNVDAQKAIAQIDYNKMNLEINKAMKEVDWDKMKIDVSKALDSAKMAIDSINWDEMKANLSRAQAEAKQAMATQKLNMGSLKIQIQKSMQDAQQSLHEAQVELKNYKGLTAELEKDGLIQKDKPYRIQLKDGTLYINGVKQNKAVTDKYSRFYQNKKDFSIGDNGGTDL